MNPSAPCRVTSTASRTVPKPVMTMAMMSGYRLSASSRTFAAVDSRQSQIRNQDVEGKVAELCERLFPAAGLLDAKVAFGQSLGHDLAKCRLVIDEQ